MLRRLPKPGPPSPAMVVALVALFVSLGGVGYAAATGSIGTREIANESVRSKDVRNRSLTGRDIQRGSLGGSNIKPNSLTGSDIRESRLGRVPSAESAGSAGSAGFAKSLAANAVTGAQVANGTLDGDDVGRAAGTFAINPDPIPANSCVELRPILGRGIDARDDAIVVTPESNFPTGLLMSTENSTTVGLMRLNICNATGGLTPIDLPLMNVHWVAFDVD